MNVFERRSLTYTDDNGMEKEIVLTVPMPVQVEVDGEEERAFGFAFKIGRSFRKE